MLVGILWAHNRLTTAQEPKTLQSYRTAHQSLVAVKTPFLEEMERELEEETGQWLIRAQEMGLGHRVWRSDAEFQRQGDALQVLHRFAILAPGQTAPGPGMMFSWDDPEPAEIYPED